MASKQTPAVIQQIKKGGNKMYALINTFGRNDYGKVGYIMSQHRTMDAAILAEDKFHRQVKRSNGGNAYVPTKIVLLTGNGYKKGQAVYADDCKDIHLGYAVVHGDVVTYPCDCPRCTYEG